MKQRSCSPDCARIIRVCLLLTLAALCTDKARAQLEPPVLTSDSEVATAGYYQLKWESDNAAVELPAGFPVELEESTDVTFGDAKLLYAGSDPATVISGRSDGTWFYRARLRDGEVASPWSDSVTVTVAHHPLSRALSFFALGIVVFLATVWLIVRGPTQTTDVEK